MYFLNLCMSSCLRLTAELFIKITGVQLCFVKKKKKNLKSKPEITLFLASRLDETDFLCFNIQPQTTTQTLCNTHTHTLTRATQVYTFGQIVLYNTTLHIKEISLIPIISSFFLYKSTHCREKKQPVIL